jgi:hypothetical protein
MYINVLAQKPKKGFNMWGRLRGKGVTLWLVIKKEM